MLSEAPQRQTCDSLLKTSMFAPLKPVKKEDCSEGLTVNSLIMQICMTPEDGLNYKK